MAENTTKHITTEVNSIVIRLATYIFRVLYVGESFKNIAINIYTFK